MSAAGVSDSTRPLSNVAKVLLGQSPDSRTYNETGNGFPFLQGNAEFGTRIPKHHLYCTAPNRLCEKGDILLSVRAPVGATNQADQTYAIGRGLAAIRFACEDQNYGWHALRHAVPRLDSLAQGSTFTAVSRKEIEELAIWFPDGDARQAIAAVLDTLDRAIEQTEALLVKQQRIKTGLMHDLLTRGLDAQGRLRDPSTHGFKKTVLGSVPVEWDETDIGALAALVTSGPRGWARYYSNAGAKFIRIGNLTREHVNFRLQDMQFVSPPDGAEGNRTQLIPGDVLFSITADLGVVGLVPPDLGPAYINQHIALIRPKTGNVVSGWLANFLASHRVQKWISNINESGAKAGLNLPTIKGMPVTAPKPPEQQMIADILALCDRQIAEIYARVLKLRRQKAGLMHDLLTGRVPVTPLLTNPIPRASL